MTDLVGVLSDYERTQPKRAFGGIYALAGFDYQLRLYVAQLAESLAGNGRDLDKAGRIFLEALSDLAEQTTDGKLVCIQAKRSLTNSTLKDAAAELLAIDQFLALEHPDLRDQVQFELVASQGDKPVQWDGLPAAHPAQPTVATLLAQGRLLQPRIEADPGWRAIAAVWKHLKDPYGFVRFALDRALRRTASADDAMRVRDDICERFKQDLRSHPVSGQLLTPRDFHLDANPGTTLEIGREVTLARMRDQQYMPRPHRLDSLYASLLERKDLSLRDLHSAARVFWIAGRSGVGKSVLLLQAVERLVADGWRVLWLGGHTELLEQVLRAIADAPADLRPEFIAVDDLYDRDARTRIDLARLGDFIDEQGQAHWPLILTCGPAEFAEAFEQDSRYRGFEVYRWTVQTIAEDEARKIETWYRQRTGHTPQRGPAFGQTADAEGGLFISLAVELAHGDLREFALRFADRVRVNGLADSLLLPLALNRLYLRTPYDWLTEADREKLVTLNTEGDFRLLEPGQDGQIVRLTHPHLADALYRALRKPGNPEAYANDLIAIFGRALREGNTTLTAQLLRLFSTTAQGLATERLAIVDAAHLAKHCAKAWEQVHTPLLLDPDDQADAATSWACWSVKEPGIAAILKGDLFRIALDSLEHAYKIWPGCWERLAECAPQHADLLTWASRNLSDPRRISHPAWSFLWERCLITGGAEHSVWRDMGLDWLQRGLRRPDWHFVWKKLLPFPSQSDWTTDPALILGMRRLKAESDGADWAFVQQDLFERTTPSSAQARELADLGYGWLAGREDRAEWAHVWRALLSRADALPESLTVADLPGMGHGWLAGREDRAEWAHVWRNLLSHAGALPGSVTLAGLLDMGHGWLAGREDRAEWAHVWQDLLSRADALPRPLTRTDLLEIGHGWLAGREDRAEWNYVWRALLSHAEALPERLTLTDLLDVGHSWLAGREDRVRWAYVWRALLSHAEALPESITPADMLEMGHAWLDGREDRVEWAHVWQDLLNHGEALPGPLSLAGVLEAGHDWLAGREDRAEWAHVWEDLLNHAETLPGPLSLAGILKTGHDWLAGREDRAEWAHVWQDLVNHAETLPEPLTLAGVLKMGHDWLAGRENRAEWAHIWQDLLGHVNALPEPLSLTDLLNMGHGWLAGRETCGEWGFICEALLERRYRDGTFLKSAEQWLKRTANERAWPIAAAKFIGAAPHRPTSSEFAGELTRRIHASPNSRHWSKIAPLFDGPGEPGADSGEIRALYQALAERRQMPVWEVARERMAARTPVQGTVTAVKERACSVELEIGLMAIWPWRADRSRRAVGTTRDFFIVSVSPDRDFVQVGTRMPVDLHVGRIYEGQVIAQREFGLLIEIGQFQGLLHRKNCDDFSTFRGRYPVGSVIRVRAISLIRDRLELAHADFEASVAKEEFISVGQRLTGIVSGIKDYGVFVRLGKRSGLIHRSVLPPALDIGSEFSIGETIQVAVVGVKEDGKLNLAPAES